MIDVIRWTSKIIGGVLAMVLTLLTFWFLLTWVMSTVVKHNGYVFG